MKCQHCQRPLDPSPEEIAARCREIRKGWRVPPLDDPNLD